MKLKKTHYFLILIIVSFLSNIQDSIAQGIKGRIYDETHQILPFATIYIRSTESGTTSNSEGYYEVRLAPGKYDVVYQFLGYETLIKVVEIKNEFLEVNVVLKTQDIVLQSVVVTARKNKDPAFTIMRKAIAKAKFHLNELDSAKYNVYLKGASRLVKSPFFLRKQIAKDGVDSTAAFTSESYIEMRYKRPDQYTEKVISIRAEGNSNNTSPTSFINGSFYEPEIAEAVSPLSPKAFAYYKFYYEGTFMDRGFAINKIKVVPRSRGDRYFSGTLNIIEDLWSIHSLDLTTSLFGVKFRIRQIYDPIKDKVWLPISHKFDVAGKFLGFEFEYDYLATVSNYEITLNPELINDVEIIDEKEEKEIARELKSEQVVDDTNLLNQLQKKDKLTRKDFRKIMKTYEEKEREESFEENVVLVRKVSIDSAAYSYDSTYWQKLRPVPLNKYEKKGYLVSDSLAVIREKAAKGDSTIAGRKDGFGLSDLLFGNTYKVGNKMHLTIKNPLLFVGFNTVEGFNFRYSLQFTKTFENKHWFSFEPTIRYAVSRNKLLPNAKIRYKFSEKTLIEFEGGQNVNQYNPISILPVINSLSSLFFERNYMKIYEQNYFSARLNEKVNDKLRFSFGGMYSHRKQLFNNSDYSIRNIEDRAYTSNIPVNDEINTEFTSNKALLTDLSVEFEPIVSYRIINGRKIPFKGKSPLLKANVKAGFGDVNFSVLDLSVKHQIELGALGYLSFNLNGGHFFNNQSVNFIDFKHFQGNQIFIQFSDLVGSYRLLDYYRYSTSKNYFSALIHNDFNKFIITRLAFIQEMGLKESAFINYLATESSQNYTEVGYSVSNIFRFFRIEGIASFKNGKYYDWGLRFGISTGLNKFINVNSR